MLLLKLTNALTQPISLPQQVCVFLPAQKNAFCFYMKKLLPGAALLLLLASCKQNNAWKTTFDDPLLYCKTVKKLNNVVLENNFPPMIAARNYAYANVAAYECMAAGSKKYRSMGGQLNGLRVLPNWDTKNVDFHLAALLAFVKVGNAVTFPEGSMMEEYDNLKHLADSTGMPNEKMKASIQFSDSVAAHIMAWSKQDNYLKTRSAEKYTINEEEGRWVLTPPAYSQALEPHWREIRVLVLDSCNQFMPPRPVPYNIKDKNSPYYKQMMTVKNTGDSLTAEQKWTADFWDDNPFRLNVTGHIMFATKKFSPAGHWMNIVGIGAQKAKADFDKTITAYALTSVALFDGFISCWDEKYRSNYIRPETVIEKYVSPEWQPYIQTPPFPSYPSGHSVISAAASEVMTKMFGDNLAYRDTSETEFGIDARDFPSFRKAALEASISRMYGGIHYPMDLDNGNAQGKKIGNFILYKLTWEKK